MLKAILLLLLGALNVQSIIHINQVGYYPNGKKTAIILDTTVTGFTVKELSTGETVLTGPVTRRANYQPADEYAVVADFTSLKTVGSYKLFAGNDSSYLFTVATNRYKDALKESLRSFYFQRCSYPLLSDYAGVWERKAGHPDTLLSVLGVDGAATLPPVNVSGGWYDAGDYGKYVVNAGITVGTLLGLHELCPTIVGDNLNIPESNNGISDLLDEVRYEIEWLARMQDTDGGVFFKVGPISWPGSIMPSADVSRRYVIGKSTTSTLNFAAVMAMAARIYKQYDSTFSGQCLIAAESAWQWACENRSEAHPSDTRGTGPYEDGSDTKYSDEFFWAASELLISSGAQIYRDTLLFMLKTIEMAGPAWWQNVTSLGFFSLATHENTLGDSVNAVIKKSVVTFGDIMLNRINSSSYRTTMKANDFQWGSAGNAGNQGVLLAYAHYLTGEQKYLDGLVMSSDFLFGKNATGYSFLTGFGIKSPLSPHHRPSQGDGVKAPIPGFVVGGPNQSINGADLYLTDIINSGAPPAKCYIDAEGSWASNEVAINQNAPWVLILGYLEQNADTATAAPIRHTRISSKSTLFPVRFTIGKTLQGLEINYRINSEIRSVQLSVHTVSGKRLTHVALNPLADKQRIIAPVVSKAQILIVTLTADGKRYSRSVVAVR